MKAAFQAWAGTMGSVVFLFFAANVWVKWLSRREGVKPWARAIPMVVMFWLLASAGVGAWFWWHLYARFPRVVDITTHEPAAEMLGYIDLATKAGLAVMAPALIGLSLATFMSRKGTEGPRARRRREREARYDRSDTTDS